ncbi:hypothetical protein F8A87_03995 [Betaproteobacteria bacterium SCN2]|jgi:TPP-dependent trihydroxycyclohexane-1,2-dione (THcHDO) dehydratase|nr:hypothetical protein F8A87_03995 [Betaproteobacteria bacterium SCN2]
MQPMEDDIPRKVLIVVSGGIAYAYAESGVQVAIADLDNMAVEHDDTQTVIHTDYKHLLESAGVDYPTDKSAASNQAEIIKI